MVLEDYGPLFPTPGIFDLSSTVFPLRTTETVSPFMVIFISFHCPTGLSAFTLGKAPFARRDPRFYGRPKAVPIRKANTKVDLRFATSSNEDSRVRIFDGPGHWLSVGVYLLVPVLIEDFRVVRRACRSLEPPVQLEGVIGETFWVVRFPPLDS